MLQIRRLDDFIEEAHKGDPVRVGVVAAHDPEVIMAVSQAQAEGIVQATLVGDWPAIEAYAAQTHSSLSGMEILHEPSDKEAALIVLAKARAGGVDAIVKGHIKTADLLGACLNRHIGIRGPGLMSHVAIFEVPGRDRLLYLSDSGIVIEPDVYQKLEIINNAVAVAHGLGLMEPKVAILAATSIVHPKIPASIDALALAKMAEQGWVEGARVDGPMGLDEAISAHVAELEGNRSPIAGQADIVIVPNVETGNMMGKGLQYFAHARMTSLVVGAQLPVIITSRSDPAETRYLSLATAAAFARRQRENPGGGAALYHE